MNVLVVGSGGREHAIAARLAQSPRVKKIYAAPGNAGIASIAECVAIPVENVEMLAGFARKSAIDLTIVGPELPLTLGLVDQFRSEGLKAFGPGKRASVLEASKIFTKEFCERHRIPTAPFRVFESAAEARAHLEARDDYPVVIKADGLAAGKGVIVAKDPEEARKAVAEMMLYERFGASGRRILVEDFLPGEELSFIVATDGKNFAAFPAAQDHKRVFDDDRGPNTGGMGAYAPAPLMTDELRRKIEDRVIAPTLAGMAAEDRPYVGFLYAGLMVRDGEPQLIEYNCRLGDPEAEVILPLMKSDFVDLAEAAIEGRLDPGAVVFEKACCAGIVLASGGYPDTYRKGFPITGLDAIDDPDVTVFHAGTALREGRVVTDGGRVLVVSAKAPTLKDAVTKAYAGADKIRWNGMHYRRDIGARGLRRIQES